MPNKSKWQRFSPLGLLLIGLGLSVTGDAMIAKGQGRPWFVRGTVGLVLFNAGLAVFGEAVKARALYEQEARPLAG